MDKWFKDILPDKDPYHNRGRDQMRKKGGPEFECLWSYGPANRRDWEKKNSDNICYTISFFLNLCIQNYY